MNPTSTSRLTRKSLTNSPGGSKRRISAAIAAAVCSAIGFSGHAQAATVIKNTTTSTLDTGATTWSAAPATTDIGLWDSTSTGGLTVGIGTGLSIGALQVTNATGNVSITGTGGTLTLNGSATPINGISNVGIDLSNTNRSLTIAGPVALGASQTWLIGNGFSATNANAAFTINNGISGGTNGLTIQGLGRVDISSTVASTYTGATAINGGELKLNFASGNALTSMLSSSTAVSLSSGFFLVQSNSGSAAVQQTVNGVTINQGASVIQSARGASAGLNMGLLSRSGVGGTVLLNNTNGASGTSTTNYMQVSNTASTLIGGWAVYGANVGLNSPTGFAQQNTLVSTNTKLIQATTTNDTWAPANNTTVTLASNTITAGLNTQTLTFGAATASTVTLAGTSQVTSGGILLTNTVGANNEIITGGILQGSTNGDLIIHQYSGSAAGGAGTLTINSQIADATGATALTKTGTGVLILGGNNTFTGGVYLNAGEIRLANAGALNSTTPNFVSFSNGNVLTVLSQVLSLNGNSVAVSGLNTSTVVGTGAAVPIVQNINASTAATLTINNGSAGTFAGTIQNGTGSAALGLTKTGAGTQNLTGSLTYTGATAVNGGTLKLSAANNLNTSSGITVGASGILDVTAVTGGQSIGSGKTLSGSGSILGSVTLASGSTTTPGGTATVGTLSIGSLTLNSGSTTNFEWGVGNDKFTLSTALTIGTFSAGGFNLLTTGGAQLTTTGVAYTLFDYTGGTLTGFGNLNSSMILNPVGGITYAFANTGSLVTLTLSGAAATIANWINDTGTGNWSTTGNWSGGVVPTNATDTANFVATTPNNPAHTVTLDSARTVGIVNFDDTTSYTISGANTLTLDNGGSSASVADANGSHTIAVDLKLASTNTNLSVANSADTLTISGAISNTAGTPGITKIGNGTVVLSGANTYTGTTTVSVGTLLFANENALYNNVTANWTDTNLVVSSGATAAFSVGGGGFTASDIQTLSALGTATGGFKNGSFIGFNTAGSFTYSNVIANTFANANALGVVKLGAGTLVLDQPNTYTGGTILNAGALNIDNNTAIGTGRLTINGGSLDNTSGTTRTLSNNNLQTWNNSFAFTGTSDLIMGTGAVTLGNSLTATVTAGNLTVGGAISGGFNFAKTGAGTLILTGASTYGGTTTVNTGTLQVGNGGATGSLPGTQINLNNSSILAYNNTATQTISSFITGTGSVNVMTGTGATQTNFTNTANNFSGGLTIGSGARVALGNGGTGTYFGSGTLTMSGGTLFGSSGGSNNKTFAQNIAITSATSNSIDLVGSTVLTLTGNISGAGTLTRIGGTASLTFSGADNSGFTGTFSAGVGINSAETFTTAGSGSAAGTWDFSSNAVARTVTLQALGGGTISFGSLNATMTGGGTNIITNTTSAATISVGGTNVSSSYAGTITGLTGANAISLVKTGSSTFTLGGVNTYAGTTNVNTGTLVVSSTGSISSSSAITVGVSGTFQYDGTTAPGAVSVDGILKGTGTLGSVTINAGGFVKPGDSPGTLSVGNFSLATGTLAEEIIGAGGTINAGGTYDLLSVTGTVTLGGTLAADGTITATLNDLYFIINNDGIDAVTGLLNGAIQGGTVTLGGQDFAISYTGDYGTSAFVGGVDANDVVLQAIPEPSTWAAVLGGMGLLVGAQTLRRRNPRL